MKRTLVVILLCFAGCPTILGQQRNVAVSNLDSLHVDGFNRNRTAGNVDSALFYISGLAVNEWGFSYLQSYFHESVAGLFFGMLDQVVTDSAKRREIKNEREFNYRLLKGIVQRGNSRLSDLVKPLYLCVEIRWCENEESVIKSLVEDFVSTQLGSPNNFDGKISRYALLIYTAISNNENLQGLSHELLQGTMTKLSKYVLQNSPRGNADKGLTAESAWYRWMYSCASYLAACQSIKDKNVKKAGLYFKTSCAYSMDLWTRAYSVYYYRDMIFLFKCEILFQDSYFDFLVHYTDNKEEALKVLLTSALFNPRKKGELKEYFDANFLNRESFDDYWIRSVNEVGKEAPDFKLGTITGLPYSLTGERGKWVLVDFWGTWCGPCRYEHPQLEKFYEEISKVASGKISLITVACKDHENDVLSYMKDKKYSFPVAMADSSIQQNFQVDHYPSKYLITPQGKFVPISVDVDWVEFVSDYVGLPFSGQGYFQSFSVR